MKIKKLSESNVDLILGQIKKILNQSDIINDTTPATDKVYSSNKIESIKETLQENINSIDDTKIDNTTTYSSNKINNTYVAKEENKSLIANTELDKIHEHTNKDTLDELSEDTDGTLMFKGLPVIKKTVAYDPNCPFVVITQDELNSLVDENSTVEPDINKIYLVSKEENSIVYYEPNVISQKEKTNVTIPYAFSITDETEFDKLKECYSKYIFYRAKEIIRAAGRETVCAAYTTDTVTMTDAQFEQLVDWIACSWTDYSNGVNESDRTITDINTFDNIARPVNAYSNRSAKPIILNETFDDYKATMATINDATLNEYSKLMTKEKFNDFHMYFSKNDRYMSAMKPISLKYTNVKEYDENQTVTIEKYLYKVIKIKTV